MGGCAPWRTHSCVPCSHSCEHVFGRWRKRVDTSVNAARTSACATTLTGTIRVMIQFVLETDRELLEGAFRFAQKQVRRLIERDPDYCPMYTVNGKWKHEGPAWTHWCDGFLPGMMWIFERRGPQPNGDAKYWLEQAIRYKTPLEPRKHDRDTHDLGFIFMSTYYRWYNLSRDAALKAVLIEVVPAI